MENKQSYFVLDLTTPYHRIKSTFYRDQLKNSVDLVLGSMGMEEKLEEFHRNDQTRIIYLFKTSIRKRKGQLVKFCNRYIDKEVTYAAEGVKKSFYNEHLKKLNEN